MRTIMMLAALLCAMESIAQKKDLKQDSLPAAPKADTAKTAPVKPYDKVITPKVVTRRGLLTVHQLDENYYLEIPDSLLNRELLLVNRIAKAPQGLGFYAGDQIDERVITFEKGPGDKLFMRGISHTVNAGDTSANGMYQSVLNSNVQPILAALPVKTYNIKEPASVVDITDLISTDNSLFGMPSVLKTRPGIGALQRDRSYVKYVRTFSQNVEIRTLKTWSSTKDATGAAFTYELNNSLVLLPKVPMRPRYNDGRVGFFTTGYTDFDANPHGVQRTYMITRWRLEPKPEDMEKYKRGELVEPQKPIVIYIDPSTPKKWVPYLLQGVNDWQKAFEQAGFKNAIFGKLAPANDSTWSLEDAAHSAIVYMPSETANAMGPHVHDPRSGEILETHIYWYHNVMSLLHDWYLIQAGAIDPKARKMELDDELMGQLIRFVSSHEVGHTLGLQHNFGSSSTVPVDSLRSKKYVEAHGHTPSIMDYARFNYVAQPEDGIGENGIFPRINDYDRWAIEWGYRLFPDVTDQKAEEALLNKWIIDSISGNPRLWYGPQQPFGVSDPRCQNEDLGDNAIKAGEYGIKNLKRITTQLPSWTLKPNEGYNSLKGMFTQLVGQYERYCGHVLYNIGGDYTTPKAVEEKGEQYLPVAKSRQQQAMAFLDEQVFTTPQWLFNKEIAAKVDPGMKVVYKAGASILGALMSRLPAVVSNNRNFGTKNNYTPLEFFADLKKSIWRELSTGSAIDTYRRDLQNVYINNLVEIPLTKEGFEPNGTQSEIMALIIAHTVSLQQDIKAALPRVADQTTRAHLLFAIKRIDLALNPVR